MNGSVLWCCSTKCLSQGCSPTRTRSQPPSRRALARGRPIALSQSFGSASRSTRCICAPNNVVFNAMLAACQRGGATWRSQLLAVFASMSAHGVTPDAWA